MVKGSEQAHGNSPAARLLVAIARDALASCDPAHAVERSVWAGKARLVIADRTIRLAKRGRLIVLAYGKAAAGMMQGLYARLEQAGGERRVEGLVIVPRGLTAGASGRTRTVREMHGDHPVPLRASFEAGRRALALASRAGPADDVIYLASGGGSSLMAAPLAPFLRPADKTLLNRILLGTGAPIGTINTVRRHLSAIKGGRLAVAARAARTQATLVVSDVDPERHDQVASGPSLPDPTTIDDLVAAIDRHGLAPALPERFLAALHSGRLPETPKSKHAAFRHSVCEVILSNRELCNAALRAGMARGLSAESILAEVTGSVEESAEMVARAIEAAPAGTRLLVMGGEVLTVPGGEGIGGRAQELGLRLALRMEGLSARSWAFLALGSDGIDGNSPAAGAYVDSSTLDRARHMRLDPGGALRRADAHRFFRRLGDDLVTGSTGTNVRDLYLLLTGLPASGLQTIPAADSRPARRQARGQRTSRRASARSRTR